MAKNLIEKLLNVYLGKSKNKLSDLEKRRKLRIDKIIELKLNDITISDLRIIKLIQSENKSNITSILQDIAIAERIIALQKTDSPDPEKAWKRYLIYQSALETYRIAREKNDSFSMAKALDVIGKYSNADKEDSITLFDKIMPFVPEITTDPSVLGITPIKNIEQVKEKLLKKYTNAIDVEYEEINSKEILPE